MTFNNPVRKCKSDVLGLTKKSLLYIVEHIANNFKVVNKRRWKALFCTNSVSVEDDVLVILVTHDNIGYHHAFTSARRKFL